MADDPKPPEKPEAEPTKPETPATEVGGRKGLEPTRYGDWEKGGIAVDF